MRSAHRHLNRLRRRRASLERRCAHRRGAERRRRRHVRWRRLEDLVVGDERPQRADVVLRIRPAALRPRREQPADEAFYEDAVVAATHEAFERNRRRADIRVPQPGERVFLDFLRVRLVALDAQRVRQQLDDALVARAVILRRVERVGQVRQPEDGEPIRVAHQPRDVRVLVAAVRGEHLDHVGVGRAPGRHHLHRHRRGQRRVQLARQVVERVVHHLLVRRRAERAGRLHDVEDVGRQIRAFEIAAAGPEREAAVLALIAGQLLQQTQRLLAILGRRDAVHRERLAEIGSQQQAERARSLLLGAIERVLAEVADAFAEADERGGREVDLQAAEVGDHTGGRDDGN